MHYARRHPGVCISPSHTTLACPRCTFLLCNMARHWGDQGRVRQATRASEHTGEANPILVTRMGVALTAACCVTIDAKASPNRRCTTLSFACSCGGYQTCSKPSGKEREKSAVTARHKHRDTTNPPLRPACALQPQSFLFFSQIPPPSRLSSNHRFAWRSLCRCFLARTPFSRSHWSKSTRS